MVTQRTEDLTKLRDKLLAALDAVDPEEIPRISKELRAVNAELQELEAAPNADVAFIDELRARAVRRSAS